MPAIACDLDCLPWRRMIWSVIASPSVARLCCVPSNHGSDVSVVSNCCRCTTKCVALWRNKVAEESFYVEEPDEAVSLPTTLSDLFRSFQHHSVCVANLVVILAPTCVCCRLYIQCLSELGRRVCYAYTHNTNTIFSQNDTSCDSLLPCDQSQIN